MYDTGLKLQTSDNEEIFDRCSMEKHEAMAKEVRLNLFSGTIPCVFPLCNSVPSLCNSVK